MRRVAQLLPYPDCLAVHAAAMAAGRFVLHRRALLDDCGAALVDGGAFRYAQAPAHRKRVLVQPDLEAALTLVAGKGPLRQDCSPPRSRPRQQARRAVRQFILATYHAHTIKRAPQGLYRASCDERKGLLKTLGVPVGRVRKPGDANPVTRFAPVPVHALFQPTVVHRFGLIDGFAATPRHFQDFSCQLGLRFQGISCGGKSPGCFRYSAQSRLRVTLYLTATSGLELRVLPSLR